MLDIKTIRENTDTVRAGIAAKNCDPGLADTVLELDGKRRELLARVEALKSERNATSKQIGLLRKQGEDTSQIQAKVRDMGKEIAGLDEAVRSADADMKAAMLMIPNLPGATTPIGSDESANVVQRDWGSKRTFDFEPQSHIEIGEGLGLFDFPRAARLAGAGFPLLIGQGARLQRALIQFMLDLHTTKHGYTEILPPFVVNDDAMTGTGQLPKMFDDMYRVPLDGLWLIPTAEVPVTNIYREEIIDQPLPICMTAYTPCFRREAGAAGKMTRGLLRVHQFDKVEMVKLVEPGTSYEELETLVGHAEAVLQALDLPYRVLELCSGDISFAAAKCYDLELWAPGQDAWLEVSSCSNFEDFQARRAGIRYRDANGKPQFVHTLNGSGVALPRLVVAILENYQQADGSVTVPDVLRSYMGGLEKIG